MPPTPQSNVEKYLHVIAGHGGEIPSEPLSRVEYYLDEIVKGGGIGGKLRPEIVSALPTTGETGLLYLVPSQGSGRNLCDEYFWIEDESRFELLGQAKVEVDLSGYVPNSRKVGGKPLSNDIGITISGTGAIEVADNGTSSAVAFDISHKDSGVTAGSKGDMTNQTPGFGGTFKALSATVDAKGHVTALGDHTARIPDAEATVSAKGLMSATDKAKLDKHVPKGSATRGIYIDASDNTQAMTHELNADVPSGFAPASAVPLMDATAAVGSSAKYAREDHVHPTDTSRASAADVSALQAENALLRELLQGVDTPIYRKASGNPATFADGYAANVKALSVTLTPTQSGSGDPSPENIRPISGATSVSVTRTGKNLADFRSPINSTGGNTSTLYTHDGNGILTFNGVTQQFTIVRAPYITLPAGNYVVSGGGNGFGRIVILRRRDNVAISDSGFKGGEKLFSLLQETEIEVRVDFYVNSTLDNIIVKPMIRRASDTDPTFEPYQAQTVTVQLTDGSNDDPLTVYGGTLNVTTGELTVTHASKTVSGGLRFYRTYGSYSRYVTALMDDGAETQQNVLVSNAVAWDNGTSNAPLMYLFGSGAERFSIFLNSDLGDGNTYMSNNPMQVVYALSSPVTYQLTPAQLATLSGYNNVTTDAGTLSVTYRADPSITLGGG